MKKNQRKWIRGILSVFLSLILVESIKADIGDIIYSFDSPGTYPFGLVFDGNCLWNVDGNSDTIYCLDPLDGTIIKSFSSPDSNPYGLTWGRGYLWLADNNSDQIFKLDPDTGEILFRFPSPGTALQGLAWDGGYLWCVDDGSTEHILYQIDSETGEVLYSIDISSITTSPDGLSFVDGEMFMVDKATYPYQIVKFNPYSLEVSLEINLVLFSYPWGVAWNGQHLFLTDHGTDKIYLLNLSPNLMAELSLNNRQFGVGDTLSADVKITNDDTPDDVMLKMWLRKPDQSATNLFDIPRFHVEANSDTDFKGIFTHTFPGGWEAGDYTLGVRLLEPETGSTLSYSTPRFSFSYAQETITFPSDLDTYSVQYYPYWWVSGDKVEGERTLNLSDVNTLEMNLTIGENYLTEHGSISLQVLINNIQVGSFDLSKGDTEVIKTFNFAPISGPVYTVKLLETNTVIANNGSVVIPMNVSTFVLKGTPVPAITAPTNLKRLPSQLPVRHKATSENMNLP